MDVADIEELARQNYNAIDDSYFSAAEIYRLIYRAQRELAVKANCIERTYTTTSTSGTSEYSFPTNAFALRLVEYNSVPLQKVTERERYSVSLASASATVTGTPKFFSIWNRTIKLTPTPDTSSITIRLHTYNFPQTVTLSSTLEVPAEFQDGIVDYILRFMYAKDGNIAMSRDYQARWDQTVADAVIWNARRKRANGPAQVQSEDILEGTILGIV